MNKVQGEQSLTRENGKDEPLFWMIKWILLNANSYNKVAENTHAAILVQSISGYQLLG